MAGSQIGALIAAAGKSERMGFDKALLPVLGRSLLAFSAHTISRIKPSSLYVTLPPHLVLGNGLWQEIAALDLQVRANRYPEQGYGGSIKTVLEENARTLLDGMLITPVDAPIQEASLVMAIANLARYFWPAPAIIVPYFRSLPGHPVYISKHFFRAFINNEITSLRALLVAQRPCVKALFWPDETVLINLNYAHQFRDFIMRRGYLNPSLSMGDAASKDAPMGNCSNPRRRKTISKAPNMPMRSISST